jgi:hypothetical protein
MLRLAAHFLAVAFALLDPAPLAAAPPTVPASLPYQGLLLDGLGTPRTGSVDLTVRIWDGLVAGTLVYKQTFPAVALADGVFTVQLGPTGDGADAPANPLTTSLATALAGDAGATAPLRFLEVTVNAEGGLARTQILASAYAVRAASAASADTATNATGVGGFSAEYVTQFLTFGAADGGDPPNTDPSEGLADTDGDGRANFVDPDNDADGLGDAIELAQGSDVNLVTPTVTGITPATGSDADPTLVTVSGTNFTPGLTFTIGSQTPAISNLGANTFDATVGPQPAGAVSIAVTLPNGQSDGIANAFTFVTVPPPPPPTLTPNPHGVSLGSSSTSAPGYDLAVVPGTTQIALGGYQQYGVGDATGAITVHPLASKGSAGQIAVAFDASGRVAGLRCRDTNPGCAVELLVDSDADGALEDETGLVIENVNGTATLESAQLARNPSGGWVAAYVRRAFSANAVVANDRNADGDFADAGEVATIEPAGAIGTPTKSALAIDAAGRVAYAYWASGLGIRIAWDRNGDGDYADTVGGNAETFLLAAGNLNAFDLAFDAAGRLAATFSGAGGNVLARDANDDGDFADAGEQTPLSTSAIAVAAAMGQPIVVAYGNEVRLDKDDDGDFADAGEHFLLTVTAGTTLDLVLNGGDRLIVATGASLFVGETDLP